MCEGGVLAVIVSGGSTDDNADAHVDSKDGICCGVNSMVVVINIGGDDNEDI